MSDAYSKVRDPCLVNLFSPEWQAVVAVAVSILGLVATFYTAFGSSARRLRSDLATDVQLEAGLEGDAKDDLKKSITDRSYRLVAATSYPNVTWYESALALVLAPTLWILFATPENLHALAKQDAVEPILLGPGQFFILLIIFVTYGALVRSWSGRAADRVVYVYSRLGDKEAQSLTRLLAFPAYIVPAALSLALAIGVLLNVKEIAEYIGWPVWVVVLLSTAIAMFLFWIVWRIGAREKLSTYLRFYTDVLHAGADIPRLRPVELGQTAEELASYQLAYDRRFPGRRRTRG